MSFTRVAPVVKVNYADTVKAWLKKRKDGSITCTITIAGVMASNFPYTEKCYVYSGTDADEGKMQIEWTPEGDIETTKIVGSALRIVIPAPHFCPKFSTDSDACAIISRTETEITFSMPIASWKQKDRSRQPNQPKPSGEGDDARNSPPNQGSGGKRPGSDMDLLDPVIYLGKKGKRVVKLAHPFWQVDGERVTDTQILTMINHLRTKEGLNPLRLYDLAA